MAAYAATQTSLPADFCLAAATGGVAKSQAGVACGAHGGRGHSPASACTASQAPTTFAASVAPPSTDRRPDEADSARQAVPTATASAAASPIRGIYCEVATRGGGVAAREAGGDGDEAGLRPVRRISHVEEAVRRRPVARPPKTAAARRAKIDTACQRTAASASSAAVRRCPATPSRTPGYESCRPSKTGAGRRRQEGPTPTAPPRPEPPTCPASRHTTRTTQPHTKVCRSPPPSLPTGPADFFPNVIISPRPFCRQSLPEYCGNTKVWRKTPATSPAI